MDTKHNIVKTGAMIASLTFLVFIGTQAVWGRSHCYDCFDKYGFPFPHHKASGFVGTGHTLWLGLTGDVVFAFVIALCIVWVWRRLRNSN
jgi:hypothetical protein